MSANWVYFQVGVDDLDGVPPLVGVVADWVSTTPAVVRWFYLQYFDHSGPHLRIRVLSEATAVHAVRGSLSSLLCATGRPVRERWYAPELEKFGGAQGIAMAEELFSLGTGCASELLGRRATAGRLAQAALNTRALVGGLPSEQQRTFLYYYAWYWAGRGRLGPLWDSSIRRIGPEQRDPKFIGLLDAAHTSAVGQIISGYADAFWNIVARHRPEQWRHSAWLVAMHHIHLQNNRLGALPADEARLARLLYLERAA